MSASRTPIDALLDTVEWRCSICRAKAGTCDCWEKCSCGYLAQKGQPCSNPETARCSSKIQYGRPACVAEIWKASAPSHQCTRPAWAIVKSSWGLHPLCRQHEKMINDRGLWVLYREREEFIEPNHLIQDQRRRA